MLFVFTSIPIRALVGLVGFVLAALVLNGHGATVIESLPGEFVYSPGPAGVVAVICGAFDLVAAAGFVFSVSTGKEAGGRACRVLHVCTLSISGLLFLLVGIIQPKVDTTTHTVDTSSTDAAVLIAATFALADVCMDVLCWAFLSPASQAEVDSSPLGAWTHSPGAVQWS